MRTGHTDIEREEWIGLISTGVKLASLTMMANTIGMTPAGETRKPSHTSGGEGGWDSTK